MYGSRMQCPRTHSNYGCPGWIGPSKYFCGIPQCISFDLRCSALSWWRWYSWSPECWRLTRCRREIGLRKSGSWCVYASFKQTCNGKAIRGRPSRSLELEGLSLYLIAWTDLWNYFGTNAALSWNEVNPKICLNLGGVNIFGLCSFFDIVHP